MRSIKLTSLTVATAMAASLAVLPATRVAADGKDFIVGALIGGVVGSQIQKQQQRQRAKATAPRAQTYVAPGQPRAQRTYRPSIPVTQEGKQIQTSLNYFGFDAGTVDGQVGARTRDAISDYQRYMGYTPTGQLTLFEQELLTSSYTRAQAGGDRTFQQTAGLPDGSKGLLKLYREEIASGARQHDRLTPQSTETIIDL